MSYQSPIRDLIKKLDAVASVHLALPQVTAIMGNLYDHLSAVAYAEEVNQREGDRDALKSSNN